MGLSKFNKRFSSFFCGRSPLLPLEKGAGEIFIPPENYKSITETCYEIILLAIV